jgi:hypothetical protein
MQKISKSSILILEKKLEYKIYILKNYRLKYATCHPAAGLRTS